MAVAVLGLVIIIAAAFAWHRRVGRSQSPQGLAFTTTFASALFLVTGLLGYGLQQGSAPTPEAGWSNTVIWPQVILGVAFLVASVFSWRRAVKDAERRLERPRTR